MKYRTLGSTGMKVSVIGLGTWQFGGEWGHEYGQKEADAIIDAARDDGINLIDTAECYGDHTSERFIGERIRHERDSWIVATKFGHQFHSFLDRTSHWKPEEVQKQLEDSLRALRTDHIDLYQFHSGDDEAFDTEGLWEMLERQKEAGKIRHIGNSISLNTNIHQTRRSPMIGVEAIQVVYNRLDREPEEAVLPSCLELNLGVLARVPLASGFLSGKYSPGAKFGGSDVRSRRDPAVNEERLRTVEGIRAQEVPEGDDMAEWALAWCLRHPAVTCVIPGCKSPEQVHANARAAERPEVWEGQPHR